MSACDEANATVGNHPEALALELTCPICLQLFSEPFSLPCGHIYCLACLQALGEGLDKYSCPECQAEYQGTTALVKSFKMCNIVETYKATAGKKKSLTDASDDIPVTSKSSRGSVTHETDAKNYHSSATAGENQEDGAECKDVSTGQCSSVEALKGSNNGKMEMDEPKFKLASQVTELNLKLEMAESVLREEKELESEVTTSNSQLREKASKLLEKIKDLAQSYCTRVAQMIEEELGPGEASVHSRVSEASELTKQLRQAMLKAESLLTEEDESTFSDELQRLQPCIVQLLAKPSRGDVDLVETKVNPSRACPKLENMNSEMRETLGEIQRSLRNTLNPSEVTFDPDTAHPNLLLSEDLKTVTYSAVKQPYPSSFQRFTNFFQVLSTQSFSEGDHSWEVELEGSPWIIGVCYSGKLARSGLPSALESSRSSWCLMWFNNLLTAFEQGQSVPLKRTTVSRRLEIKLCFKTHRLSFYNISPTSAKTHIYTFKANLTEPVHIAYRMMSGHPKARVTIFS